MSNIVSTIEILEDNDVEIKAGDQIQLIYTNGKLVSVDAPFSVGVFTTNSDYNVFETQNDKTDFRTFVKYWNTLMNLGPLSGVRYIEYNFTKCDSLSIGFLDYSLLYKFDSDGKLVTVETKHYV